MEFCSSRVYIKNILCWASSTLVTHNLLDPILLNQTERKALLGKLNVLARYHVFVLEMLTCVLAHFSDLFQLLYLQNSKWFQDARKRLKRL